MRILVVCQHYWPEPFNTADVCEELVRRGHEVTVLTGLPNTGLEGGEVPEEYRHGKNREQVRSGVTIQRAWLWPRRTGAKNRVLNYLSFWFAGNRLAKRLDESFDVVIGYQFSPVMQVDPGLVYARRTGAPVLLYSFDLWPESLKAGGFSEASLPFKWVEGVSRRIYSEADCLAVTSRGFFDYFKSRLGIDPKHQLYLPQYAEDIFTEDDVASKIDGFDTSKVNLVFAGNIGAAQSVETIIEAANILRDSSRFIFHIVGSGSSLEGCEKLAAKYELTNVVFHGRKPLEEMPAYYANADAMLATFSNDPILAYTLPRKVTTYLAAGKPVIGTLSGEARRVIEEARCGYCCDPEDAEGLAEACLKFDSADSPERLGNNARKYFDAHYSKERFFDALENALNDLKGTRHGA